MRLGYEIDITLESVYGLRESFTARVVQPRVSVLDPIPQICYDGKFRHTLGGVLMAI